jgi:hypothetical protein
LIYCNKYDLEGTNSQDGYSAEQQFKILAESKGYVVEEASREQQFRHIDLILKKDNKIWLIDVKAKKKLRRKDEEYNFEWLWLELVNVRGDCGWIFSHGFCAFEMEDHFIVVAKKDLAALVEKLVDCEKEVARPEKAKYSVYRRFGRKDKITLIESKHLKTINHSIWPKIT